MRSTNLSALLFDPRESLLGIEDVRFVVHCDVVWREAADAKVAEKGFVPAIKNVHLRKRQFRVLVSVESSVLVANVSSPIQEVRFDMSCFGALNLRKRGSVGRELAM